MSLPPEKASELKQLIHQQLSKMDVHGRIREILAESIREELAPDQQHLSTEDLIKALRRRGIIDDVMKELNFVTDSVEQELPSSPKQPICFDRQSTLKKTNIDPTRRYLYLQVLGGKAFLEHLQEPEPLPGQVCSTFTLCLHYRNQRFRSKPVPCACEPDFHDGFLLEVHRESLGDGTRMADSTTMLSISDPIHMVLIKTDIFGETTLVASYFLEWRSVLGSENGVTSLTVELMGVGTESKVSVGILNIKLEMYPPLNQTLSQEVVNTQLALERQKTAEKERLFLVYAKQWWREYLQIRPSHNSRLVKIFAQDENGINRPVCSYVKPLRAGRLLDTPRQAARFVNVLGYERAPVIGGGGKQEQWCTLLAFLCRNKGDCEDHANLLCSLLLGYGLEAFVCVGTKAKGVPHAWVMTCGTDGTITFWESLTGHRYIHKPTNPDEPPVAEQPKPLYPYRTIGCVFNHQMFLGNCQPSDAVETCVFDLNDESKWKPMSEEAIKSVCAPGATTSLPPFPPLCASTIDASVTSNEIEMQLRLLVSEHRKDLGLTTVWEDQLSYLLSPALASYEFERTTSISAGNEEFQDAIRRAVPDGHTFKGFPIHFVYRNARRAFATCLRSPFCEEIICCRGDQVRLAVRVRVFTYPESACAVWIMFACKLGYSQCMETEVIESLGIIIYKALDYGLKENEERELSPPLEQLIDHMANTVEADGSNDEGYEAAEEGLEDEDGKRKISAIRSYRDVMKLCAAHLPTESDAPNHYQAVCRALFAETMELHTFLTKIKSAKENLKKIQEMEKSDESSTDLEELKNADWARFWVQVMRDLRNGVKLKKVQERQYNPLPIEYQLTPYEMLMDDIRCKRYTLRKVMVNGDIPPRLKKSAHEIILDFIRSRPPLNPVSARKLKPTPPRPRSLHERILEEIKAERKLRPVSPEEIRRSRLAMRPLSMSYSFDLSDVTTPKSTKNLVESSMVNGGLTSQTKENGLSTAQQVPAQRKKLLKAPTLAELDSSESEEETLHKSTSSSSVSPSFPEEPVLEAVSTRKKPPKFLPISSTPQPERRQPPQRRHSIEKETPTNVRQFLPPSRQSSRSLEEFCYPVECLALTVEEVMHIRQVLVKAELEKYQQYKDIYTALKKGKLCFCCRTRRFSFFTWSYTCQFCKRPVCSQCCKKMRLPSKPYSTLPIFSLGPSALQRGESSMRSEKPSTAHHRPLRSIARFSSKSKSMDKSDEELQFPKELMEDWSTMEVCVDCKKFISEIISSSRRSLVLANKRARLKRKTQSFYMSSPGPSEYCPSERTISEI
ncbi:centrosomal protein of 76 kDa isoform X4 [Symphalangus syndactylus]|uniref:centrosomal protein of 76 kDa isoform X4 n=1 Tax=Symphalangus syndactylus TaxID=9590 RepID=UPI0024432D9C|nr:centrosomal protein of 76 kDa isoform X3 [Symphalangus syndactylus]